MYRDSLTVKERYALHALWVSLASFWVAVGYVIYRLVAGA